ncbi:hypothetical protein [Novosphingobium sp.]|uniref:hypothetical protein n=1 Tax=Novosphingobium sp. TaxID=1874826 RepID=UPI0033411950
MIARRMVLKSGAAGLGSALLPARLMALPRAELALARSGLVLIDPALPAAAAWHARFAGIDAQVVMLDRDLVRQWRDHLRARLVPDQPGLALVQWDKALLLTGLAREDRLRTVQRRIARGAFAVTLG